MQEWCSSFYETLSKKWNKHLLKCQIMQPFKNQVAYNKNTWTPAAADKLHHVCHVGDDAVNLSVCRYKGAELVTTYNNGLCVYLILKCHCKHHLTLTLIIFKMMIKQEPADIKWWWSRLVFLIDVPQVKSVFNMTAKEGRKRSISCLVAVGNGNGAAGISKINIGHNS